MLTPKLAFKIKQRQSKNTLKSSGTFNLMYNMLMLTTFNSDNDQMG